jgi:PAS domain S-box-containing protein
MAQSWNGSAAFRTSTTASEQRLRLAIETTGLGIWDVDLITGQREWTLETRQIVGVPADIPITADTFLTRIHPDDRARVELRSYGAQSTSERGYGDTYRIFRADNGAERWVTTSGRTLTDHDGQPIRRVGTIQDITPRMEAGEALRASEERLRLALRAGHMVAWELNLATGRITGPRLLLKSWVSALKPFQTFSRAFTRRTVRS